MKLNFGDAVGARHRIDIANEELVLYGLEFQTRVDTPEGPGSVIGVAGDQLFVLLDANQLTEIVTGFSFDAFKAGTVSITVVQDGGAGGNSVDHRIKTVLFLGRRVKIATQQKQGPCPVLALANTLALLGRIEISPKNDRRVTARELLRTIAEYLVTRPPAASFAPRAQPPLANPDNASKTIAMAVAEDGVLESMWAEVAGHGPAEEQVARVEAWLERLYDGMNIDPVFSDVEAFSLEERDAVLFTLAGVRLLHGWVIPADDETFGAIRHLSFMEAATRAATSPASGEVTNSDFPTTPTTLTSAPVAAPDLNAVAALFYMASSADQMTIHGRRDVLSELRSGEVVTLFWRNHFFTATSLEGKLLALCSDENFADKYSFVFSVIDESCAEDGFVDGDGRLIDPVLAQVQARTGNLYTEDSIVQTIVAVRCAAAAAATAGGHYVDDVSTVAQRVVVALEDAEAALAAAATPARTGPRKGPSAPTLPVNRVSPPADALAGDASDTNGNVTSICEMFPSLSRERAGQHLIIHGNNVERAVEALLLSM